MQTRPRIFMSYGFALALLGCSSSAGGHAKDAATGRAGHASDSGTPDAQAKDSTAPALDAANGGSHGDAGAGHSKSDAGAGIASDAGSGTVSIFVAQGHKGRLTISCDDGHSWIADHSTDDSVHCFDTQAHDCDHDPEAGRGLAYGNGYFLATFGWGMPGHLSRSKDGISWESFPLTQTFADIAFGNGMFVANDHTPAISMDGKIWTPGGVTALSVYNTRAIGFVAKAGGRFVVTGETSPMHDVVISKDNAKSWLHPSTLPPECGANVTGIAASPELVVITQAGGRVCSSADGGDRWVTASVAPGFSSPPIWTGKEFMAWNNNTLWHSPDAQTWTSTSITPSSVQIGQVAINERGTLVAVNAGWDVWYDKQAFYRSSDGITWEVLAKTAFKGSHPIYFIEAGRAAASAQCPAR